MGRLEFGMKKRYADQIFKNGAYLIHQDDIAGSIEKGKRADLIVLDRNLFDILPSEINQKWVLLTLFEGRPVYQSGVFSDLV